MNQPGSIHQLINMKLWNEVIDNETRELEYQGINNCQSEANMASLSSSITSGFQGVEVNFQGFNDGLPILVDKILH